MKLANQKRNVRKTQNGSAIVAALWVSMALAVLIGTMIFTGRTDVAIARHTRDQAILDAALQGGINLSLAQIDTLRDRLGTSAPMLRHRYRIGEVDVSVEISDEAGRIDVNAAPRPLLRLLFESVSLAGDKADVLADQMLDWRDRNETRRRNGAERQDYVRQGRRHGPTNGPMMSIDELALLLEMTASDFDKLAPVVTVFSRQRGFDPSLSPPELIQMFSDSDGVKGRTGGSSRSQLTVAARKYVNYSRRMVFRLVASASFRGQSRAKTQVVEINPYDRSFHVLTNDNR